MRAFAAALLLVLMCLPVEARIRDDRYFVAWGGMAQDVVRALREKRSVKPVPVPKARKAAPKKKRSAVKPMPRRPAPVIVDPQLTLAEGFRRELIHALGMPRVWVKGPLSCARNVNAALAERGVRGTGSALAKSFLRWGRSSRPVPGAVAIYNRGRSKHTGHVAIVARVDRGRVLVWNPSRRGWRLMAYRKPAIAYRVAG